MVLEETIALVIGAVIGAVATLAATYVNNRAQVRRLKEQHEMSLLEKEFELKYKDQEKALKRVFEIVRREDSKHTIPKELENFLESFEGSYLPRDISSIILKGLADFEGWRDQHDPSLDRSQNEAYEAYEAQREAFMDPLERFEYDYERKLGSLLRSIQIVVREKLKL